MRAFTLEVLPDANEMQQPGSIILTECETPGVLTGNSGK